jgi:probable F420-dependent oxidoreductase
MRPVRFGVLAENARTPDDLIRTARLAEDAGFSTLLIRDHLVEHPFDHQLGPLTALAFVAVATRRLRVGTLVLSNDFRHPAVLAKEVATLDALSGGRVELGIGAGFLRREYEEAGLPFDPPGVRVGRLEESLRLLKRLLAAGPDQPVTHHGVHYRVDGLRPFPPSVQRPHPPIHVAAARPRMLGIAAREADIVNVQTVSTDGGVLTDDPAGRGPEAFVRQVERLREAAGDRMDRLEISTVATVVITDRPRQAAEDVARRRGWGGLGAGEVLAMPSMLVGPPERVAELVAERRERFGLTYLVISDGRLAQVAPALAGLVSAVP